MRWHWNPDQPKALPLHPVTEGLTGVSNTQHYLPLPQQGSSVNLEALWV